MPEPEEVPEGPGLGAAELEEVPEGPGLGAGSLGCDGPAPSWVC